MAEEKSLPEFVPNELFEKHARLGLQKPKIHSTKHCFIPSWVAYLLGLGQWQPP